jgi:hypothetical protein
VRAELARFGPQAGLAGLVERWPEAVGDAIARHAWPARIGRDGTLHVATADSVWAFELAHRGSEIAGRLGVARLRFAPGPLPEQAPAPPPSPPQGPSPEHVGEAGRLAAEIGDENVRETVEKAIAFSLARAPSDRPV